MEVSVLGHMYEGQNCSAARALELVGERWSLLIIRDALFREMTRFSDFQRSLGVAPNILAARLDRFVEAGLMERHPGSAYRLTAKGRDLQPVLLALTAWGDTWAAPDGPPIRYAHHTCGGQVHLRTHCTKCGQVPDRSEVIAV
jgi:DNA-binding HxlR family transcriptional regulator